MYFAARYLPRVLKHQRCDIVSSVKHVRLFSFSSHRCQANGGVDEVTRHKRMQNNHRFEKLHTWEGPLGLAKHLLQNVIYQDNDIIVFNKPSGVPMYELKYDVMGADHPDKAVSMSVAMEYMKQWLNLEYLKDVYSQPRLYSGIVIFAKNPEVNEALRKYFIHTKAGKVKCQKYRVIVSGVPEDVDCNVYFPVWREQTPEGVLYFKSHKTSRKHFERRQVSTFEMEFRILKSTKLGQSRVSYLEVDSYLSKWNSLELCITEHQLCSVLGDDLYSNRLQSLQGRKVLIGPQDASIHRIPQVLEPDIATALRLRSESDTEKMPLHIHCSQVQIPRTLQKTQRLNQHVVTFDAALPDFFFQSLNELNLTL